jgi:hypothetical protein
MTTEVWGGNVTLAAPPLTEIRAERTLLAETIFVFFVSLFPLSWLQVPWWVAIVLAVLFWTWRVLSEVYLNALHEPVVRVSPSRLDPGHEVLLQCELRARSAVAVRGVIAGFESEEGRGEFSHTERHGEWALSMPTSNLGSTPTVVEQRLRAPAEPRRQWSRSRLDWYLTLRVELEGSKTVRRRYHFAR